MAIQPTKKKETKKDHVGQEIHIFDKFSVPAFKEYYVFKHWMFQRMHDTVITNIVCSGQNAPID